MLKFNILLVALIVSMVISVDSARLFTGAVQVGENIGNGVDDVANKIGDEVGGVSEDVAGSLDNGLSYMTRGMTEELGNDMSRLENSLRNNMPRGIDFGEIIDDVNMPNMPSMPNMRSPDAYSQEIQRSTSEYYNRLRSLLQRFRNGVGV